MEKAQFRFLIVAVFLLSFLGCTNSQIPGLNFNSLIRNILGPTRTASCSNFRSQSAFNSLIRGNSFNLRINSYCFTPCQSPTVCQRNYLTQLCECSVRVSTTGSGGGQCSRCHDNSTCIRGFLGQYNCRCQAGFTGNGFRCTILDTCGNVCHSSASCVEGLNGESQCVCNAGYTGNGATCTRVRVTDRCGDACHANAQCARNQVGRYECVCRSGFAGDGRSCSTIQASPCGILCDANAECARQSTGRYGCNCNDGFTGNGFTCTADATDAPSPCGILCDANARCVGIGGGRYQCDCDDGFTGDGLTCTPLAVVPPCGDLCDSSATCVQDEANNFQCTCNVGYAGNGFTCSLTASDLSFCSFACDDNAVCVPSLGEESIFGNGYKCECNTGYSGDGFICAAAEIPAPTSTSTGTACPANQFFSLCATCVPTCDQQGLEIACPSGCQQRCTCPTSYYLLGDTCVRENECSVTAVVTLQSTTAPPVPSATFLPPVPPVTFLPPVPSVSLVPSTTQSCPSNQVYSTCAGCDVTCENRLLNLACTLECREKCTCPDGLILNGEDCVYLNDCPPIGLSTTVETVPSITQSNCAFPCQNGGSCIRNNQGNFVCSCLRNFFGVDCARATPPPNTSRCRRACSATERCVLSWFRFRCVSILG